MDKINNTKEKQKEVKTINDYERAVYYVLSGDFDPLMVLMCRTRDDVLAKRIQIFLHNYYYSPRKDELMASHDELLHYIDHALLQTEGEIVRI